MGRRIWLRVAVVVVAVAATVGLVSLVVDPDNPDYEGISSCTLPSVVPAPEVTEESTPLAGVELVPVADIERATVTVPWIDDRRLLVANRDGLVWLVDPATGAQDEILDLSARIALNAEGGIVGGAISPDGAHVYLHHTDLQGTSHVLELATTPDGVDPASEREVLRQPHPGLVHNGGAMTFGPDGYLYLGFGDGGGRPEDAERVASLEHLDGKILRIDPIPDGDAPYTVPADNPYVGRADARPEIWATGLRNPYRFTIDPATGDLWTGDVGESCYEEIDRLPGGAGGEDLGFPRFEGTHEFLGGSSDDTRFPVFTYTHAEGCAVIVGVVVHDPTLTSLRDRLLFSDFCEGGLDWLQRRGDVVTHGTVDVDLAGTISFGVGPDDEVYVLTGPGMFRLQARS